MTTKATGDIVVVDVTIKSATKAKRGEKVVWSMNVFIPALGIKQYPTPFSMDAGWATDLVAEEQHRAKFSRGKLREGADGKYDNQWFWEIMEWDTLEDLVLPESSAASPNGQTGDTGNRPDIFRTKEELRWTEAMRMAVRSLACNEEGWDFDQLSGLAFRFYELLEAGPPGLLQAATQEPEQPTQKASGVVQHFCHEHGVPHYQSSKTGTWGHLVEGGAPCLEDLS